MTLRLLALLGLAVLTTACSDDGADDGTPDGDDGFTDAPCSLRDDSGGPGQYSSSCVRREWIAPYVGTYSSGACTLTLTTPAEGPAAVFELALTGGESHTIEWEGGSGGAANDSYYRFTTDATFATTKTLNFTAAEALSDTEEQAILFKVEGLDTGTTTFQGLFQHVVTSPYALHETPCGALTKAP